MNQSFPKFLVLFFFLIAAWTSLQGAQYKFKFHQFLPLTAATPSKFIQPWIEKVEKESQGRIAIVQYPSMQLGGSPASLINQVKDGTVDFIWTLLGYTPGRFPKSEVFELPFIATRAESTSKAFYEYHLENLQEELKDYKVIALHTHGPGLFHTSTPVRNLADVKGKKLRGPTRVITQLLESLGGVGIGMPAPRIPESLSKGVIDGAVIPWGVTQPLKTSELVKNHTIVAGENGLYTATFIVAMNKNSYNQLPPDLKKVIDDNSGLVASAWAGRVQDEDDVAGRNRAIQLGNNLITLSVEETEKWKKVSQKVIQDWVVEMNQKGFDGQNLIQQARQLIQKHSQ